MTFAIIYKVSKLDYNVMTIKVAFQVLGKRLSWIELTWAQINDVAGCNHLFRIWTLLKNKTNRNKTRGKTKMTKAKSEEKAKFKNT